MNIDGTWRSLVARFLGVEEAVSSNLAVPKNRRLSTFEKLKAFFLHLIPPANRLCKRVAKLYRPA